MATLKLTTGDDTFVGTSDDDIVTSTADKLNPGDRLDAGSGTDTLSLSGPGLFDVGSLAQFSGFETVRVLSVDSGHYELRLGAASVAVDLSATGSAQFNQLTLGSGTTSVMLGSFQTINFGTGQASASSSVATFYDTFNFSSGTATVSLSGQGGYGNTFNLSSGSTTITAANVSGDFNLSSGDYDIDLSGFGGSTIYSSSVHDFHANDRIARSSGNHSVTLWLMGADGTYDLSGTTLSGIGTLALNAYVTLKGDGLSGVATVTSFGQGGTLVYSGETADLSGLSVAQAVSITSANTNGTTFVVKDVQTALDVRGGAGHDTLDASTLTLTAAQRDQVFALGSVEIIKDTTGTYNNNLAKLTTGTDAPVLVDGQTLVGTASTLNSSDQLVGAGHNTLALYGPGLFDVGSLAQFSGFETVRVLSVDSGHYELRLGAASVAVDLSATGSAQFNQLTLGSGTTSVMLGSFQTINFGTGQASASSSVATFYDTFNFSSGTATVSLSGQGGYGNTFNLSSGSTTITAANVSGDFNLSSGDYDIDLSGFGGSTIYSSSVHDFHANDRIARSSGNHSVTLWLMGADGTYDLSGTTLSGIGTLALNAYVTLKGDGLSGVATVTSFGQGGTLVYSGETADLSGLSVAQAVSITSANTNGTTFVVKDVQTALDVRGGAGHDTLDASTLTLTAAQRDQVFALGSVEIIKDTTGTYNNNLAKLTTGTDAPVLVDGQTLVGTASTLNSSDQLVGAGHNTLALYGPGLFDVGSLAQFSGFETVRVLSVDSGHYELRLGAASVAVDLSATGSAQFNQLTLGSGTTSVMLGSFQTINFGTGQASASSSVATFYDTFNFSSGTATVSLSGQGGYGNTFNLSSGSTTITAANVSGDFNLSSGDYDIDLSGFGGSTIYSSSVHDFHANDRIARSSGNHSVTLWLMGADGTYDLSGTTLSGIGTLALNAYVTLKGDGLSGVATVTSFGQGGTLVYSGETADLSGLSVAQAVSITSANTNGTTFVVKDVQTALDVRGGAGHDTLDASTLTLTAAQRDQVFALGSVEIIKDTTGTYAVNLPPVSVADTAVAQRGTGVVASADALHGVLANDSDPEGDALTVTAVGGQAASVGQAVHGTFGDLTLRADGSWSYAVTTESQTGGHDVFGYRVADASGNTAAATLDVTVPGNAAPAAYATSDTVPAGAGGSGVFNHLIAGADPDGDPLTLAAIKAQGAPGAPVPLSGGSLLVQGLYGTLYASTSGAFTYMPNAASFAAVAGPVVDRFDYVLGDGHGGTAGATFSLRVDRPPVPQNDAATAAGMSLAVDASHGVLANDGNLDGDALAVTGVFADGGLPQLPGSTVQGAHGTLQLAADGSYTYTFTGPVAATEAHDRFVYTLADTPDHSSNGQNLQAGLDILIPAGVGPNSDATTVRSAVTASLVGLSAKNLVLTGNAAIDGTGNDLDNLLIGNGATNTLIGNAGNDSLNGGAGADTMRGGLGNDRYYVNDAGDRVYELINQGTDHVFSSVTFSLSGQQIENLTLARGAAIGGTGNSLANVITGNDAANTLDGGSYNGISGDDTLDGGFGADTMIGRTGNDTYYVDNAGDVVVEAAGEGMADSVYSTITFSLSGLQVENLTLIGAAAINGTGNSLDNVILGNGAANILDGGIYGTVSGDDTLDGGAGADRMVGRSGNDTYVVDNLGDVVIEAINEGIDTVNSSVTFSLVGQYIETLTLTGTAASNGTGNGSANLVTGNGAANALDGGGANDVIDGRLGADILTGGAGQDTYVFSTALGPANLDRITFFNPADDKIQLSASLFGLTAGALAAGAFKNVGLAPKDADDRILYNPTYGTLSYDDDGSGAHASTAFAMLDNKPTVDASAFFVV